MVSKRYAFTLIELIFAIVIIGISVFALPMFARATNEAIKENLVQEAILLTSADAIRAMSAKWDENTQPLHVNIDFEYILYTSDAEIIAASSNTTRSGNIRILYEPTKKKPVQILGLDDEEILLSADDVDDYITTKTDALDDEANVLDFKNQYKKSIRVNKNASFGTLIANANLKKLTVTTHNSDGDDLVELYMYIANTGSAISNKRTLP